MSDDNLYIRAAQELKQEAGATRDDALWAKAQDLAGGNDVEARNHYMNLRVDQLQEALSEDDGLPEPTTAVSSVENHPDYISVAKYSARNAVDERHVIQSIQDGSYKGRQVAGEWYVFIGKNKFGTFEEKKSSFFFEDANEMAESKLNDDAPDKVINLPRKSS